MLKLLVGLLLAFTVACGESKTALDSDEGASVRAEDAAVEHTESKAKVKEKAPQESSESSKADAAASGSKTEKPKDASAKSHLRKRRAEPLRTTQPNKTRPLTTRRACASHL